MSYLEEYKNCSCTSIQHKKTDLPVHCPKHGTKRKYIIKIPDVKEEDVGYVEN